MKLRNAGRPPRQASAGREAIRPRVPPAPVQAAGTLDPGMVFRLQAAAGNAAVGELLSGRAAGVGPAGLVVQRQAVACPPPPAPPTPADPQSDPRFRSMTGKVKQETAKLKQHPSGKAKSAEAGAAAHGPTDEVEGKASAAKVDELSQKRPRGFDKAAFIAKVHEAIERATPRNMEQVDEFSKSDKAGEIKGQVAGEVTASKDASSKDIEDANAKPPDASGQTGKPVEPMGPESPGPPPGDVEAGGGMPSPRPEEQASLESTRCETDSQLAEAHVTREQVDKSNEPQFQDAMKAKEEADEHAATAPGQFRANEQQSLDAARGQATGAAQAGLSGAHQSRASALNHVESGKDDGKAKQEGIMAKATADIKKIYQDTEREATAILTGLDGKVTAAFDAGERTAHDAFLNDYKTKKDAYFDKRYSGLEGAALWVADKFSYPSAEVNAFIEQAKQLYVTKMEQVIDQVATLIETELNRATARIQQGRQQIQEYVKKQPADLKQAAQQAANDIQGDLDRLDQQVTEKSGALVDTLAEKYVAASQKVDEECKALQEENKGLLDKARDKIDGMIDTIKKMKAMLQNMAARAGDVVDKILDDPISFLNNLIAAVKQGFSQFADNIWTHLKKGLLGWLFGEVAKAGITLPASFDLKGILMFLAQLLGLTWANIRSRAVKVLGGKVVGMIEKGAAVVSKAIEIYNVIKTEGIAGVWHLIQDKVAEIKEQVMSAVGEMVVTQVVVAGIKWVIGLLNPASAFVKACMAIYDIVMWLINHAGEIVALVNAVIDNLAAIVAGNIGAAANLVEQALARAIPIAIGFLASLLGLGDLGAKIKKILEEVRQPVFTAVDWVLTKVVKPVIGAIGKGVQWVKDKLFGKKKDTRSPAERKAALDAAMAEGQSALVDPRTTVADVKKRLTVIKSERRVEKLDLVVDTEAVDKETVHIEGANSPTVRGPLVTRTRLAAQRQDGAQGGDDSGPVTASGKQEDVATGGVSELPFDVEGAGHKLVADPSKGEVTIESTPKPVMAVVNDIVAALNRSPVGRANAGQAAALAGQITQLVMQLAKPAGPDVTRSSTLAALSSLIRDLCLLGGSSLRRRSVSVAWYEINGERGDLASMSGDTGASTPVPGENLFYQTFVWPPDNPHPRHVDSELKILASITHRFGGGRTGAESDGIPTATFPDVRGSVHFNSDFVICPSCAFAVGAFRRRFPGVEVVAESNLVPTG